MPKHYDIKRKYVDSLLNELNHERFSSATQQALMQLVIQQDKRHAPNPTPLNKLKLWAYLNAYAMKSNIVFKPQDHQRINAVFQRARDLLNDLLDVKNSLESHSIRQLFDYCMRHGELCLNRADAASATSQYEFAHDLISKIALARTTIPDSRRKAKVNFHLAEAMTLLQGVGITSERTGSCIRNAIYNITRLPLGDFQPDDYRLLAKCQRLYAHHFAAKNEHQEAERCYNRAIAAIIEVPIDQRVDADTDMLEQLRKHAASEDQATHGWLAAVRHYGLFRTTSKFESGFPHHAHHAHMMDTP